MEIEGSPAKRKLNRTAVLLCIGPVLLFLAATAFGVLEVHSSTDTWIGLAAGKQILTSDEFPTTDTFSYTFYGKPWYNQNWLTHLGQYWLYLRSPNAVIYGTWALSASVFLFTLLAAYWRSKTWFGALIAAAVVGYGCRDFLSARPATTGFFCIAALWALICALEGQGDKRRWWPIVLLLPLLLIWGNAHGSFVFGYGVLGLYVGHWFVVRTIRLQHSWAISFLPVLILIIIGGIIYSLAPIEPPPNQNEITKLGAYTYYTGKLKLLGAAFFGYLVYWLCIRGFKPKLAIKDRQVIVLGVVVMAGLMLTIALGPFGLKNFTHGQKIAGSSVFRQVSEWNPPFAVDQINGRRTFKPDFSNHSFPPMARFWWIFIDSCGLLALGLCLLPFSLMNRRENSREKPPPNAGKKSRPRQIVDEPPVAESRLHITLFDLTVVIIGLCMTFWARRFAPIFYIFGMPIFLTWFVMLMRPMPDVIKRYGQISLAIVTAALALLLAKDTYDRAYDKLVKDFEQRPQFNLLERVTRYDASPHNAIMFLKNNQLNAKIVTEWTQAGPVMFHAPNAKVFMDGRAQQVYSEEHYQKYAHLLVSPDTPARIRMLILNEFDTNAILLRRTTRAHKLWLTFTQSEDWIPVLTSFRDGLFLRRGSEPMNQLCELLRQGKEWRPNTPAAIVTRGFVWAAMEPPNPDKAIQCWQTGLNQDPFLGRLVFEPLTDTLLELGRVDEARQRIRWYYETFNKPSQGVPDKTRQDLLKILSECWSKIEAAPAVKPADKDDN